MGMYHREKGQEAFLVLAGKCTLIVEGKKRVLTTWDVFYCLRRPITSSSRRRRVRGAHGFYAASAT